MADKRSETLAWFAEQMRAKLERDRHKGDNWQELGVDWLFDRLAGEMGPKTETSEIDELETAIYQQDWENVIRECADVANFAMMIADTARALLNAEQTAARVQE
jgi:NTP pyrophosphatase (non-canonical NTP hydrolase)